MLIPREWQEEEEVFEQVAMTLEQSELDVSIHNEEGAYGQLGYIVIKCNGKRYQLSLKEEV